MKSIGRALALALALATTAGAAPAQQGAVERGKYLMQTVVACGNCHTPRGPRGELLADKGLSGGFVFDGPPFRAVAANITPDLETGIGKWTDAQLAKAIREGIRPDNTVIGPPMPIEFYRYLSDDDLNAIVAYLRAQPPVRNAVDKSKYNIALPPNYGPPITSVTAPPASNKVAYGKYLADIAHCMDCHTPRSANGMLLMNQVGAGGQAIPGPWGQSITRNLTPHDSGLKNWTDEQIATSIRTGKDREGKPYKPPMGFSFYKGISDSDMAALIAYLRSLKPLPLGGG